MNYYSIQINETHFLRRIQLNTLTQQTMEKSIRPWPVTTNLANCVRWAVPENAVADAMLIGQLKTLCQILASEEFIGQRVWLIRLRDMGVIQNVN